MRIIQAAIDLIRSCRGRLTRTGTGVPCFSGRVTTRSQSIVGFEWWRHDTHGRPNDLYMTEPEVVTGQGGWPTLTAYLQALM